MVNVLLKNIEYCSTKYKTDKSFPYHNNSGCFFIIPTPLPSALLMPLSQFLLVNGVFANCRLEYCLLIYLTLYNPYENSILKRTRSRPRMQQSRMLKNLGPQFIMESI